MLIQKNTMRENAKRVPHEYNVGDKVLVRQDPNRKHDGDANIGPFTVTAVNENGTVLLSKDTANGGVVIQKWNIRQLYPYKA
jgi:hypothetical protein